jgi:cytochrome b561
LATQAQLALNSLGRWGSRHDANRVAYGCLATFTALIGVLGLIPTSSVIKAPGWRIAIHVLFGQMIFGLVFARFRWCVRHSTPTSLDDINGLSRHLSRIVYLLLYVVIGARLIVSIGNSIWQGTAIDLDPFDQRFGTDGATSAAKADFQQFFVACLLARGFVYLLAYKLWRGILVEHS